MLWACSGRGRRSKVLCTTLESVFITKILRVDNFLPSCLFNLCISFSSFATMTLFFKFVTKFRNLSNAPVWLLDHFGSRMWMWNNLTLVLGNQNNKMIIGKRLFSQLLHTFYPSYFFRSPTFESQCQEIWKICKLRKVSLWKDRIKFPVYSRYRISFCSFDVFSLGMYDIKKKTK
jgi:hypothetical protein